MGSILVLLEAVLVLFDFGKRKKKVAMLHIGYC
jgi:hypothetical protein